MYVRLLTGLEYLKEYGDVLPVSDVVAHDYVLSEAVPVEEWLCHSSQQPHVARAHRLATVVREEQPIRHRERVASSAWHTRAANTSP